MKKLLLCALAGVMAFSFTACSRSETESEESAAAEETAADEAADVEARAREEDETGTDASLDQSETLDDAKEEDGAGDAGETDAVAGNVSSEQAQEGAAASQTDGAAQGAPDVSAAVDAAATAETDAVPLGVWTKTTLYATNDSCYHTAYVRVAKVTTQSEDAAYVNDAIETNDAFSDGESAFDATVFDMPEDAELVVLDYEVYVPDDFPAASYGMPEPRLYFAIRNLGGGGIPSADGSETYVGLGTTQDLIVRDGEAVYKPGNVYAERCIYAMVRGYTNYVATYSTYPDGTSGSQTSADNLFTVYHAVH